MPKEWCLRQGAMYNDYFCWHLRESFARRERIICTTEQYVVHRNGTGGMQMLLVSKDQTPQLHSAPTVINGLRISGVIPFPTNILMLNLFYCNVYT